MAVSEKIKTTDNKIEKNKAQYKFQYFPLGSQLKIQSDIAKNNFKDKTRCVNLMKQQIKMTKKTTLKKYSK